MTQPAKPPTALGMLRDFRDSAYTDRHNVTPRAWEDIWPIIAAFEREKATRDERDAQLRYRIERLHEIGHHLHARQVDSLRAMLALLDGGRAE